MKRKLCSIVLSLAMILTLMPAMTAVSFADDTPQLPEGLYLQDAQGQDVPYGEGWEYYQEDVGILITGNDLYISGSAEELIYVDGAVTKVNVGDLECMVFGALEGSGVCEFDLGSSDVSLGVFGSQNRDIKITGEAPVLSTDGGASCDGNVEIAVDEQLTVNGMFGVFQDLTLSKGDVLWQGAAEGFPSPLLVVGDIYAEGYKVTVASPLYPKAEDWVVPSDTFGIFQVDGETTEFKYYTTDGTTAAKHIKFDDEPFLVQRMNDSGVLETLEPGPDTWEYEVGLDGGIIRVLIYEDHLYLKGDIENAEIYLYLEATSINLTDLKCKDISSIADATLRINILSGNSEVGYFDINDNANVIMTGKGTLTVKDYFPVGKNLEIAGDHDFVLNINTSNFGALTVLGDLKISGGTLDAECTGTAPAGIPPAPILTVMKDWSFDGCDIFMASDEGIMTASSGKMQSIEVGGDMVYYFVLDNDEPARHVRISKGGDISTGEISGLNDAYVYSGEAITPAVTVKTARGVVLTEGTDYTVAYKDNVDAGTATVTVTGTGVYTGTIEKTFRIIPGTGWQKIDGYWYYFNADGTMVTSSWKKDSKGWCWLQADGRMLTNGWAKDSKGWCWMGADGYWVSSKWIKDGGAWYYIKANHYMASNEWRQDSKGWCYLGSSGKMVANGWAKDSKGWCWMGADGYWVSSKWVKDGSEWYYIKANHYMACNEWAKDSGGWMWMNASGRITKSRWVQTGDYWYYLKSNGYMATGTQTIDGKPFKFDSSGRWIQ